MHEMFICDECGRSGTRAPGLGWCTRCEQEYQQGIADAARYRDALSLFGEEAALALELADDLRGEM